ncbi:UNVERIFIED_CONTAM: hypothetical protein Slati_2770500 [Sesamum latifolium]|uniref:Uncharacterized protein n=1 Tax=Sesamum latifolium TaxID=2727402 RepID=A0AAW2VY85_9LAMI
MYLRGVQVWSAVEVGYVFAEDGNTSSGERVRSMRIDSILQSFQINSVYLKHVLRDIRVLKVHLTGLGAQFATTS